MTSSISISVFFIYYLLASPVQLPVNTENRNNVNTLELTAIGDFGLQRKARPGVPEHLHTGIDIKRPSDNYLDEPIYPIAPGTVISKRTDGPFAQLIVEHEMEGILFWTVYEHISGIAVDLFEPVTPDVPIARFMNKDELNRYGWQFDHFHLEILKIEPIRLKPGYKTPQRLYNSYTLVCFSNSDLNKYFYNPLDFFSDK